MDLPPHPKIRRGPGGNLLLNFGDYGQEVEVACFSGDGTRALTVREVGVARVWEVASGDLIGEIRPTSPLEGRKVGPTTDDFRVFIEAAALDPSGGLALLGLNDGTACLFSVSDGAHRSTYRAPGTEESDGWELVRAVAFSPDESLAVVGFFSRCAGV